MPPMPGAKLDTTPSIPLQVRSRDKEKVNSRDWELSIANLKLI
jgi:hypothetical protein